MRDGGGTYGDNGDAVFWLKGVKAPHRIAAQEAAAFTEYIDTIR